MSDNLDPMTKLFIEACADLLVITEERNDLLRRLEDANKIIRGLEAELDRLERMGHRGI